MRTGIHRHAAMHRVNDFFAEYSWESLALPEKIRIITRQ